MTHPDIFLAEPSLRDLPFHRVPGNPYHKPPEGDLGPEIGINNSPNRSARDQTLHELSHELARLNDWPRGGAPSEFADGGPLAHLRLPGESPQAAYLRMLGERESNVVVKRAEMTPAQLQAETPEATMLRERSSGKFPPGPSIRLPFGKQRSLGDFDELERQGFLREQARARQDQQAAKPVSDAMREHLAREDALGDKADKVGLQAATLVHNMRAAGMGPKEIAAQLQHQFGTPFSPADVASGQGWWNVGQRPQPIGHAPVPPTMPRVSLAELWPREANLALAQAHARGGSAVTIAQQLNRQRGSSAYTPRLVGEQIDRLRLNPTRQSQSTVKESWQPDALALLTSPGAQGMIAQQLAELIYRETGQVTSKGAVIGKLDRLRAEKARQELAEDLANAGKGTTLRAGGSPLGWASLLPSSWQNAQPQASY